MQNNIAVHKRHFFFAENYETVSIKESLLMTGLYMHAYTCSNGFRLFRLFSLDAAIFSLGFNVLI